VLRASGPDSQSRENLVLPTPNQIIGNHEADMSRPSSASRFGCAGRPTTAPDTKQRGLLQHDNALQMNVSPHPRGLSRQFVVQDGFISGTDVSEPVKRSGGGFPVTCQGTWVKATKRRPGTAPTEKLSTATAVRILDAHARPHRADRRMKRSNTQTPAPPQPILTEDFDTSCTGQNLLAHILLPEPNPSQPQSQRLLSLQRSPADSAAAGARDELVSAWGNTHFDAALDNSLLNIQPVDRMGAALTSPRRVQERPMSAKRLSLKYKQDSPRRRNNAVGFSQMLASL